MNDKKWWLPWGSALCIGCALVLGSSAAYTAGPEDTYKEAMASYKNDDWVAAVNLLRKTAEANYVPGMFMLAYLLDQAEENKEALTWYKKAADMKSAEAALGLGKMLRNPEEVEKPDPAAAAKWIQNSAEWGYPQGMLVWSRLLSNGELGVPKDQAKAVEWLNKAAEQGYTPAMSELSLAYRDGKLGLTADPKQAAAWNTRMKETAAKQESEAKAAAEKNKP
ncbi:MAG: sel1 repeat family protein [Magnetococcus sp. DMHC-1]|nr:sel1 repeat family protein [Magnetococcales bacterium]